eukprot:4162239-Pyramimonas_sp.AAC.1
MNEWLRKTGSMLYRPSAGAPIPANCREPPYVPTCEPRGHAQAYTYAHSPPRSGNHARQPTASIFTPRAARSAAVRSASIGPATCQLTKIT